MKVSDHVQRGWHFLQIPGPSNTPERIRQAMSKSTLDHRGPEFGTLVKSNLLRLKKVFNTDGHVVVYPSSGTGAWEAALMNLFNPGDRILAFETGHFAILWKELAERIGLEVEWIESDWRVGVEPEKIGERMMQDKDAKIKAVMVVHNETSTGITSDLKAVREAIDATGRDILFLVDVVSSLLTNEFKQDLWGVDVAIAASQKGLMLPPGLSFNSINQKARKQALQSKGFHSYWRWERIIHMNETGYYPYTPASSLFQGLDEALNMVFEEGIEQLLERHRILASACRIAATTWGLENQCRKPSEYSNSTTALIVPEPHDADQLRANVHNHLNMSLGKGLGNLKSRVFRIGHLGDFNELMLLATLSGVEMGLAITKIPFQKGGLQEAMNLLIQNLKKNT